MTFDIGLQTESEKETRDRQMLADWAPLKHESRNSFQGIFSRNTQDSGFSGINTKLEMA